MLSIVPETLEETMVSWLWSMQSLWVNVSTPRIADETLLKKGCSKDGVETGAISNQIGQPESKVPDDTVTFKMGNIGLLESTLATPMAPTGSRNVTSVSSKRVKPSPDIVMIMAGPAAGKVNVWTIAKFVRNVGVNLMVRVESGTDFKGVENEIEGANDPMVEAKMASNEPPFPAARTEPRAFKKAHLMSDRLS